MSLTAGANRLSDRARLAWVSPLSPLYFRVFFFFILLQHQSLESVLCWDGPNILEVEF